VRPWEFPEEVLSSAVPVQAASPLSASPLSPLFIPQYKSWKKASTPSTFSCSLPSPPAAVTLCGSSRASQVPVSGGMMMMMMIFRLLFALKGHVEPTGSLVGFRVPSS